MAKKAASAKSAGQLVGRITQVTGAVIDVQFEGDLPQILNFPTEQRHILRLGKSKPYLFNSILDGNCFLTRLCIGGDTSFPNVSVLGSILQSSKAENMADDLAGRRQ